MSSLENLDAAGRAGMTIARHHRARDLRGIMILDRFRHCGNRLAGTDDHGLALRRRRQVLGHAARRSRGGNGGIEYTAQQRLRPFVHRIHAMMLCCATAMINSLGFSSLIV